MSKTLFRITQRSCLLFFVSLVFVAACSLTLAFLARSRNQVLAFLSSATTTLQQEERSLSPENAPTQHASNKSLLSNVVLPVKQKEEEAEEAETEEEDDDAILAGAGGGMHDDDATQAYPPADDATQVYTPCVPEDTTITAVAEAATLPTLAAATFPDSKSTVAVSSYSYSPDSATVLPSGDTDSLGFSDED